MLNKQRNKIQCIEYKQLTFYIFSLTSYNKKNNNNSKTKHFAEQTNILYKGKGNDNKNVLQFWLIKFHHGYFNGLNRIANATLRNAP